MQIVPRTTQDRNEARTGLTRPGLHHPLVTREKQSIKMANRPTIEHHIYYYLRDAVECHPLEGGSYLIDCHVAVLEHFGVLVCA